LVTYKFDVLEKLKESGYTSYRLRKENILGQATIQRLRNSLPVSYEVLSTLCGLLECQPGDLLYYEKDSE